MPPKKKKASLAGVAKSAADPKAKKKAAKSVAAKLKKKAKAASTKELTDEGAKVVTVAEGTDATAAPPPEPEPSPSVPTPEPAGPPPHPAADPQLRECLWADDCPHEVKSDYCNIPHYKTAFPGRTVVGGGDRREYAISFIFKGDFAKRRGRTRR